MQMNTCRSYDLIGYKAFILVIYGIEDITNIDAKSEKYLSERQKHFDQIYLSNVYKKDKCI